MSSENVSVFSTLTLTLAAIIIAFQGEVIMSFALLGLAYFLTGYFMLSRNDSQYTMSMLLVTLASAVGNGFVWYEEIFPEVDENKEKIWSHLAAVVGPSMILVALLLYFFKAATCLGFQILITVLWSIFVTTCVLLTDKELNSMHWLSILTVFVFALCHLFFILVGYGKVEEPVIVQAV